MRRFGLIGHPLGHSLSPWIHARIMDMAGINGSYALFDIEPARLREEIPRLLRELDGFNCTIPHKERLAEMLGAPHPVNTVFRGAGHNTDILGFRACVNNLAGKNVALLGSGGTARMMMGECLAAGVKSLAVYARKMFQHTDTRVRVLPYEQAQERGLETHAPAVERGFETRTPDILLNATPLGMWPCAWEMPTTNFAPLVFDAVYNPTPTRLVLNARKQGCHAAGGLRMLVRQAVEAQKIWNPEKTFDTPAIEHALLAELPRELLRHSPVHILLTGFMGAGKSSLAVELAKRLGAACVDIDAEIEAQTGRSIADIFARDGEAVFRDIERDTARRVLSRATSSVVASGGGLVISKENQDMIRQTNTLALHLDAPFETLWRRVASATHRPLLRDRAQMERLYESRGGIYRFFSDLILDATQPLHPLAADAMNRLAHQGD